MKKILLLLAAFWIALAATGQHIEVYVAKGDVQIKQKGKLIAPKEGVVLLEGCTVVVAEKAQLVLYSGEKAVVLNQPKTYTYKDIVALFEQSKKSITDKYIAYIWNQAHESDGADPGKGTSNVAGMVSRGESGIVGLIDSCIVISEYFVVALAPDLAIAAERDSVKLFVYDRKKPLFNQVADSVFTMIALDGRFISGKWYGLAASLENSAPSSGITYFKWASSSEIEAFYSGLAELNEALQDFPDDVKAEIAQAYITENRYLFYQKSSTQ